LRCSAINACCRRRLSLPLPPPPLPPPPPLLLLPLLLLLLFGQGGSLHAAFLISSPTAVHVLVRLHNV